jgi:hypothetical protein
MTRPGRAADCGGVTARKLARDASFRAMGSLWGGAA